MVGAEKDGLEDLERRYERFLKFWTSISYFDHLAPARLLDVGYVTLDVSRNAWNHESAFRLAHSSSRQPPCIRMQMKWVAIQARKVA